MQKALIITVCLTQFFCSFMGSSLNVAVEAIAEEFSVQPQSTTWVLTCFTAISASFLLCATAAANYFGVKRVYSTACGLAALSSLLLAAAPSFMALLLGRALQGMIFSLIFCTSMALLLARISKESRALGIALSTAAVYAGLSFSPTIAGLLVDTVGWRSIFLAASVGIGLAWLLSLRLAKGTAQHQKAQIPDLALSFAGLALILYSLSLLSFGNLAFIGVAAGAVCLILFLRRQSRSAHPTLPSGLLRTNGSLRWALIASVLNYMSNFSFTLLLSLHLQLIVGKSASFTGLFLMTQPLTMMIVSLLTSKLSKQVNVHTLTSVGMLCIAVSFSFLTQIDGHTPLYYISLLQVLTGLGFGLFSAPNTNIVMSSVSVDHYALVSALQALSRNLGQGCSMALATGLLGHFIDALAGTTLYLYELGASLSAVFTCSAVLAFLGFIACLCGARAAAREGVKA